MRRRLPLSVVLLLAGCAGSVPPPETDRPFANRIDDLAGEPIPEGEAFSVHTIFSAPALSAHLTRIRAGAALAPHFHESHDETVYVLSGSGDMRIEDTTWRVEPGTVIHIPRGTVHSVEADEGGELRGYAIFTPAFDGRDRQFVKPEGP
ncbi:MAG: cupin domain-containing protein [Planctomycetes bacterium]|nr:cupin domain-containing protein [Planctomycetota bacterium]